MDIKLSATTRVAPPPPTPPQGPVSDLPQAIDPQRVFISLNAPLRPAVSAEELAGMTALERTTWEIRSRSETALTVQAMALHGTDVQALLTG